MEGVPASGVNGQNAWTCPECGGEIKTERSLHRRRRHWKLAGVAALLLSAAYGAWTTPRVQRSGWTGAVPTTALIAGLPWSMPAPGHEVWQNAMPRPRTPVERDQLLYFELYWRALENDLWGCQRRVIAEYCLAHVKEPPSGTNWFFDSGYGDLLHQVARRSNSAGLRRRVHDLVRIDVRTRDRWPAGVPLHVQILDGRFAGGIDSRVTLVPDDPRLAAWSKEERPARSPMHTMRNWDDDLVVGSALPEGIDGIDIEAQLFTGDTRKDGLSLQATRRLRVPVRSVASIDEVITPVSQRALKVAFGGFGSMDDELPWMLIERPNTWSDGYALLHIQPDEAILEANPDLVVAVRMEVLRNGEVMLVGEAWWSLLHYEPSDDGYIGPIGPCILRPVRDLVAMLADGCWEVRLVSDPATALRSFNSTRYWIGEVTMPIVLHFDDEDE
jgi:hypothetical protein